MVLDRNVDNFFSEVEQLAFSPALVVPGIGFTNDRMLQTRLFSYSDTTRYRLGANFLQIPINAPLKVNPVTTQDGVGAMLKKTGHVNYYPSSIEKTNVKEAGPAVARPEVVFNDEKEGPEQRVREHLPKENPFKQAGERYRSFDPERRDRFIGRIAGEKLLGDKKTTREIKEKWVSYFYQMDEEAGRKLEDALDMKVSVAGVADGVKEGAEKAADVIARVVGTKEE
jgi:catalase